VRDKGSRAEKWRRYGGFTSACTHGPITIVWKLLLVAVRFN